MVLQQCTYFVYIFWKKGIFSEASFLIILSTRYDYLRPLHLCVFFIIIFFKLNLFFKFF